MDKTNSSFVLILLTNLSYAHLPPATVVSTQSVINQSKRLSTASLIFCQSLSLT